jgi:ubiquinol-cytochrome c reductase cytochrome b subunit
MEWVDSRLPIFTILVKEYRAFPTPKNFNYFWSFGGIAMTMLILMIVTGIVLAMHYTPHASVAFNSVERIMRDVNWGWMLRYMHMNGASFFFIAVYVHIFRGMYYGSYKKPRELLWIFGVLIFLLMMATAFMGYTLPWSQMGGWAATVITNLFSAIPLVGPKLVTLLWGGFSVDNPTLNRFFSLHYLLPFVILGIVILHVWAVHVSGSNNPLGIEPKGPQDTLPFHPYYTAKDAFGLTVFLLAYAVVTFWFPNMFAHPDHFVQFDAMKTPPHIVPEWYFLPFYAILRSVTFDIGIPFTDIVFVPAKLGGVIAMFGAVIVLFFLPWLDSHPVRSAIFRPRYKFFLLLFMVSFVILGWVGMEAADAVLFHIGDFAVPMLWLGQITTLYYFAFFVVIVPWLSGGRLTLPFGLFGWRPSFSWEAGERPRAMPLSINDAVLAKKGA